MRKHLLQTIHLFEHVHVRTLEILAPARDNGPPARSLADLMLNCPQDAPNTCAGCLRGQRTSGIPDLCLLDFGGQIVPLSQSFAPSSTSQCA